MSHWLFRIPDNFVFYLVMNMFPKQFDIVRIIKIIAKMIDNCDVNVLCE